MCRSSQSLRPTTSTGWRTRAMMRTGEQSRRARHTSALARRRSTWAAGSISSSQARSQTIVGCAPVQIFVMGRNQWRMEADWPLPDTQYRSYYLHSGGAANTANGDGVLSQAASGIEPHDSYTYDPRSPVPTVGGQSLLPGSMIALNVGPRDQRTIESRPDVLCYATPPLERDTEVTGPIELVLYIASSARDTDFTGKLVDVFPDGRALALTDGILRARYRNSLAAPELLQPDMIYELHIDLIATANVFRAGHCIRLDVSSSNFPRFDRNTNTGGTIAGE